jgi:nitrogen fixation/metabolism regulation signal transduction histidine kinase
MRGWTGLRGRLLAAFVLVAVLPLLLLSAVITGLLSRSLEDAAFGRLGRGLEAAQALLAERRRWAEAQVAAVAEQDLPSARGPVEADRTLSEEIARRRDLPNLEIVDARGLVISSRHWPAGFGLEARDGLFPGDPGLRLEKVAEGYGVAERLALVAQHPASWRGAPVIVRGGVFLDGEFLAGLARLMGAEVALRDGLRQQWIASAGSPLAGWTAPAPGERRGRVDLEGASYRFVAAPLNPELLLVVAAPGGALDAAPLQVRRLTLILAGVALVAALLGGMVLSGRLARPIRELAGGAERVARGDLEGTVPVRTGDEIGHLAEAFNAMTAELRASRERLVQAERVAAWREMARRLAHELKKPLFPIQLSIETLQRSLEREGGEASHGPAFARLFRESSETVLHELRSLRTIIEEFDQFARLPRPRRLPLELNPLLDQVLGLYQARAAGVRLERDTPDLPSVSADPDLLARAIGNLVANALEAMPGGGTLGVRARLTPAGVALEVRDSGPGLSEEQRARLFTPYYTTKPGGTGLGLVIAQGIVADHGGRLEVQSEPGGGAAFTLLLPPSEKDRLV